MIWKVAKFVMVGLATGLTPIFVWVSTLPLEMVELTVVKGSSTYKLPLAHIISILFGLTAWIFLWGVFIIYPDRKFALSIFVPRSEDRPINFDDQTVLLAFIGILFGLLAVLVFYIF